MREISRLGVLVALLAACGSDGGSTLMLDGGTPGCASQNGAAACNTIIGALCSRVAQCCAASGTCSASISTMPACVSYLVSQGTDCSSPQFTSTTVCISVAQRCANDIPLIACSDITGGTINFPASCSGF